MSKLSYLVKNTGILAIGSFSSKVLTFLLVPLYTAVLSTEEYGAYDILYSSATLLIPLLTLNIADAVLRFPLEEDADVPAVAHVGIALTLFSAAIVFLAVSIPEMPWSGVAGIGYFPYLYLANALYQLLILLSRGTERMVTVAVAGVMSTVVIVALNVVLLLVLHWGLDGFFVANIAGMAVPSVFLLARLRDVVFARSRGRLAALSKRMAVYATPLAMVTVGWWFINTSGRYIVLAICGAAANGLFSIAYKIPAVLNAVSGIFIQAWQVSAIKEYDPDDKDGFLRKAYETAEAGLMLVCSVLIMVAPALALVLFSGEFYEAWAFVPMLLVSALLNTLGGLWGPFFSAKYDTVPITVATIIGGAVNVALGIPLAMALGVQGAAIAAAMGSFANWCYRGIKVRKHIHVAFRMGRLSLAILILAAQGALMVAGMPDYYWIAIDVLLLAVLIFLYRKALFQTLRTVSKVLKHKKNAS